MRVLKYACVYIWATELHMQWQMLLTNPNITVEGILIMSIITVINSITELEDAKTSSSPILFDIT